MKLISKSALQQQLKPLLFVLVLSAIGFLLNLVPIPLFSHIHLIVGNIAFVIVAMRFGALYSLFAAIIVTSSLVISFGHPFGYIIYGLEAVVIAMQRKRGWYVLYSDLFYWFFIGMPLTALLLYLVTDMPDQLVLLTIIKQVFNGLLCACFAGLIVYFLPQIFDFNFRQQPKFVRSLKVQFVYASSLIVIFSIMTTSLFVSQNFIQNKHETLKNNIIDAKNHLMQSSNNFIAMYQLAIENSAHALSINADITPTQQADLLQLYHRQYPEFITMFISNSMGEIIATSPKQLFIDSQQQGIVRSVASRRYFQQSLTRNNVYISKVLQGRGFGKDAIVSFSRAYFFGSSVTADGIIQGSIKLDSLAKLMPNNMLEKMDYVITDAANNVVFATPKLQLKTLQAFNYVEKNNVNHTMTELVAIEQTSKPSKRPSEYFLTAGKLDHGWNIYVLLNSKQIFETVEREYLLIFALLILALFVSLSIALRMGKQLTEPLGFIMNQLKQTTSNIEYQPLGRNASKEISLLYDELRNSKQQVLYHQSQLEQTVASRTNELKIANEKLTQLAEIDGLTQVYNRRYFDEKFNFIQKLSYRNKQTLALVMLDLDNFKLVNDNHGHLIGDQCLRVTSKLMKSEFSRDTDMVARYGGEEFLILISGLSNSNLEYKLDKLRNNIAEAVIYDKANKAFKITVSMGAIIASASFSKDAGDWIKVADLCLYKAKKSGRNNVKIENFNIIMP